MGIRPIKLKGILIYVLITIGFGVLGTILAGDISGVYSSLNRPPLSPPGIVFPFVWNILYALMGTSAYILSTENTPSSSRLLRLYWLQIILNVVWSVLFWRFNLYTLSAVLIGVLILLAIIYFIGAFRVNKTTAWLFLPYIIWLMFALYLNIGIAILN